MKEIQLVRVSRENPGAYEELLKSVPWWPAGGEPVILGAEYLGYAAGALCAAIYPDHASLLMLRVAKPFRRCGVATSLLSSFLESVRETSADLSVEAGIRELPADSIRITEQLLQKQGFREISRMPVFRLDLLSVLEGRLEWDEDDISARICYFDDLRPREWKEYRKKCLSSADSLPLPEEEPLPESAFYLKNEEIVGCFIVTRSGEKALDVAHLSGSGVRMINELLTAVVIRAEEAYPTGTVLYMAAAENSVAGLIKKIAGHRAKPELYLKRMVFEP